MKNMWKICLGILLTVTFQEVRSQTMGFRYQAMVLQPQLSDAPGEEFLLNQWELTQISLRFSIINSLGFEEYVEEHHTTTNTYGEVNLIIGQGQEISGNFSEILWDGGFKQLKVEIDYQQGEGFQFSNKRALYYLPHPMNQAFKDRLENQEKQLSFIKSSSGFTTQGEYVKNSSSPIISDSEMLSEADLTLEKEIRDNTEGFAQIYENQKITNISLEDSLLVLESEAQDPLKVDISLIKDGTGTDQQTAADVNLSQALDWDGNLNNGHETKTLEQALAVLNSQANEWVSSDSDAQTLVLQDQKLSLTNSDGDVFLGPENSDDQNAQEVLLNSNVLDVDADGVSERTLEEALQNLITKLSKGCTDPNACNYFSHAKENDGSCIFPDVGKCQVCSGETNGIGKVLTHDADGDGVCDEEEHVVCADPLACNFNADPKGDSDSRLCVFADASKCETCVENENKDGTGKSEVTLDRDDDGVCDADDTVSGCTDNTACNYDASPTVNTDNTLCVYVDGVCDTCVNGVIVDNDADNDGVCDGDEVTGCTDATACNYDNDPTTDTDNTQCVYATGCETCDGNGGVLANDADGDGVCDGDEVTGCTDATACNYDASPTVNTDNTLCVYVDGVCETCVGNENKDGTGTIVDNNLPKPPTKCWQTANFNTTTCEWYLTGKDLAIEETSITHVTCHGKATGSIEVNVLGGTKPYTYLWEKDGNSEVYDSPTDLYAGTYRVRVTDAKGCAENSEHTIEESEALSISVVKKEDVRCNSNNDAQIYGSIEVNVSGGTPTTGYTYEWKKDGNLQTYTGDSPTDLYAGTYTVTVTDDIGCTKTSNSIDVEDKTSFGTYYTDIDSDGYYDDGSDYWYCSAYGDHTIKEDTEDLESDECSGNSLYGQFGPPEGYNCSGSTDPVQWDSPIEVINYHQCGAIFDRECTNSGETLGFILKGSDCDGPEGVMSSSTWLITDNKKYQDAWVVDAHIVDAIIHHQIGESIRQTLIDAGRNEHAAQFVPFDISSYERKISLFLCNVEDIPDKSTFKDGLLNQLVDDKSCENKNYYNEWVLPTPVQAQRIFDLGSKRFKKRLESVKSNFETVLNNHNFTDSEKESINELISSLESQVKKYFENKSVPFWTISNNSNPTNLFSPDQVSNISRTEDENMNSGTYENYSVSWFDPNTYYTIDGEKGYAYLIPVRKMAHKKD